MAFIPSHRPGWPRPILVAPVTPAASGPARAAGSAAPCVPVQAAIQLLRGPGIPAARDPAPATAPRARSGFPQIVRCAPARWPGSRSCPCRQRPAQPPAPGGRPVAPAPQSQPFAVVAHDDPGTAEALRHAAGTAGWRVVVAAPGQHGLEAALTSRPAVAVVGCGRLGELPGSLDVPLLAVGDDADAGDLRAAVAAGARGLLTWPDDAADLAAELSR